MTAHSTVRLAFAFLFSCAACAAQSAPPPASPPQAAAPSGADSPAFRSPGEALQKLTAAIATIESRYIHRVEREALVAGCVHGVETRYPGAKRVSSSEPSELTDIALALRQVPAEELDAATDHCILGMIERLDRHSEFFGQADYRELLVRREPVGGIGLEMAVSAKEIKVVAPLEGGPAASAGISRGDVITSIDGVELHGRSLIEAYRMLRGAPGSQVSVALRRAEGREPKRLELKRQVIAVRSLHARLVQPGIGYLAITQFQNSTPNRLAAAIAELGRENGKALDGIILDLRWCMGGLLSPAVTATAAFLPRGKLISDVRGRSEDTSTQFYGESEDDDARDSLFGSLPPELKSAPMVVLAGPKTAAGAEIVASALQDHKRAVVVGTRTFGKGTIETFYPLPMDTALKITTARMIRPNGQEIDAKGVTPDVAVEPAALPEDGLPLPSYPTAGQIGAEGDATLRRALAVLAARK